MSIQMSNFNASMYEEAVQGIKLIKSSNQRIEKEGKNANLQSQKIVVESIQQKISGWLAKIQDGYLDPQSIRKVTMIRQQLAKQYQQHLKIVKNAEREKNQIDGKVESQGNTSHNQYSKASQEQVYMDLDFEMERKLMDQRNHQIKEAHSNIIKVNSIIEEASQLVHQQGESLDIIENHMIDSKQNVKRSNQYLTEANEQQKKGNKKSVVLFLIILAAVLCVIAFFFVF